MGGFQDIAFLECEEGRQREGKRLERDTIKAPRTSLAYFNSIMGVK